MTHTLETMIPWLTLLAGPVGSGALASWLFRALRRAVPRERLAPQYRHWPVRLVAWLLYNPLGALLTAMLLAGAMSIAASTALAWLTGGDVLAAFDVAFAALLGAVVSQLAYRAGINPQEARV
jgi:hypothetical protein